MPPRKAYPSDVTDAEWELLDLAMPVIPIPPQFAGPKYPRREILNALRYRKRTGCPWRHLPHDLPRWDIVYYYHRCWTKHKVFEIANERLRRLERIREGRNPEPTLGIIDSQSVKGTEMTQGSGYDGNKKVKGRKRHLLVDVLGIVLAVVATAASVQDRDGFTLLTQNFKSRFGTIKTILVDGIYNGDPIRHFERDSGVSVQVKEKPPGEPGFVPVVKRWAVERTFGWFTWDRVLSRCYDRLPRSEEAWIYLASASRLAHRLAPSLGELGLVQVGSAPRGRSWTILWYRRSQWIGQTTAVPTRAVLAILYR